MGSPTDYKSNFIFSQYLIEYAPTGLNLNCLLPSARPHNAPYVTNKNIPNPIKNFHIPTKKNGRSLSRFCRSLNVNRFLFHQHHFHSFLKVGSFNTIEVYTGCGFSSMIIGCIPLYCIVAGFLFLVD